MNGILMDTWYIEACPIQPSARRICWLAEDKPSLLPTHNVGWFDAMGDAGK